PHRLRLDGRGGGGGSGGGRSRARRIAVYEPAPEEIVWNLLRGALGTQALAIACRLGVPDSLSEGPRPVAELARHAEVDEGALHRLLRALASDGVFEEKPHGVFRHTPASE